ncbi:MAG TPA: hypothetical protein PLN52_04960 [Opitutaceae bacterium]|nr:hypothetical protein [Opitutaceae bacterium]
MKPFLSGRPSAGNPALKPTGGSPHSISGVQAIGSGARPGSHEGSTAHGHEPQVECIKQGDKVVRLVITCTCGERIEVDCLYPAAG